MSVNTAGDTSIWPAVHIQSRAQSLSVWNIFFYYLKVRRSCLIQCKDWPQNSLSWSIRTFHRAGVPDASHWACPALPLAGQAETREGEHGAQIKHSKR